MQIRGSNNKKKKKEISPITGCRSEEATTKRKEKKGDKSKRMCVQKYFVSSYQIRMVFFVNPTFDLPSTCKGIHSAVVKPLTRELLCRVLDAAIIYSKICDLVPTFLLQ
jgi:hypothetical protein